MDNEPLRALMVARAQIQVRAAWEAKKVLLDFTPDSLRALDDLIAKDVSKNPLDPQALADVIGAYVGEVFVRRLGGSWQGTESEPLLSIGDATLDPVERAKLRIHEGRKKSLIGYYEEAAREVGAPLPEKDGLMKRLWKKEH